MFDQLQGTCIRKKTLNTSLVHALTQVSHFFLLYLDYQFLLAEETGLSGVNHRLLTPIKHKFFLFV